MANLNARFRHEFAAGSPPVVVTFRYPTLLEWSAHVVDAESDALKKVCFHAEAMIVEVTGVEVEDEPGQLRALAWPTDTDRILEELRTAYPEYQKMLRAFRAALDSRAEGNSPAPSV